MELISVRLGLGERGVKVLVPLSFVASLVLGSQGPVRTASLCLVGTPGGGAAWQASF